LRRFAEVERTSISAARTVAIYEYMP